MANFRDLVDAALDDSNSGEADRDDAEKAVNWAYLRVCTLTRISRASKLLTLVSGVGDYNLASDLGIEDFVAPVTLTYRGVDSLGGWDVPQVDARSVTDMRARWTADWPLNVPGGYAMLGTRTLMLVPAPNTGDIATLFYVARPDEMSADDDEPDALPPEYHPVIEDGALERMVRRKQGPAAAEAYRQRFLQGVAEVKEYVSVQQSSTPGYLTVGYPSRPRGPWPNDYH